MASVNNDIEKYLKGELTPAEMHALEQKAMHDPFLAEAMEGAEHLGAEDFADDISYLKQSIHEKTRKPKGRTKTITLNGFAMYAGIAAGLLLLFVSTYVIFISIPKRNARETAMQKETTVVIDSTVQQAASTDSLIALNETKGEEPTQEKNEESKPLDRKAEKPETQNNVGAIADAPVEDRDTNDKETEQSLALEQRHDFEVEDQLPAEVEETVDADEKIADDVRGPVASQVLPREEAKKSASRSVPQFQSSLEPKIVRGRVTDGNDPIPGANIVIKGTTIGTVADVNGNFEIPVHDDQSTILVNFIGYAQEEVKAEQGEVLNVQLSPDMMALNEVVVVGYGEPTNRKPVFSIAEPVGGFSDFKKYLNEQLNYPEQALKNEIEGRVTVQFTVEADGTLSDFKVIRGIGYGCDEELIRLIKEGPRWKPSIQDDKPTRERVRVRQKFTLPK